MNKNFKDIKKKNKHKIIINNKKLMKKLKKCNKKFQMIGKLKQMKN